MELISFALNIAMTCLIAFFALSFLFLIRRNIKNKKIVDCITAFDDEELFSNKIDTFLDTMKDPEFIEKGNILKLWGAVRYNYDDDILPLLNKVNIQPLIEKKGYFKREKVQINEDSFYYLCIACVNTLYSRNDDEKLEAFKEKISSYEKDLNENLIYQIAIHAFNLYENNEDRGEKFFKRVLEGDYAEYKYAKQLIGLYKELCAAYLAEIYSDQDRYSDFEEIKEDVQRFNEKKIGERILSELHIPEAWITKSEKD